MSWLLQIKVFIRVSLSNILLLHPFVPDAILRLVTLSLQSVDSRLINQDQILSFSAGLTLYFAASTKQFFPQSLMKYQSPHINSLQNFRTTPFILFRQIGFLWEQETFLAIDVTSWMNENLLLKTVYIFSPYFIATLGCYL